MDEEAKIFGTRIRIQVEAEPGKWTETEKSFHTFTELKEILEKSAIRVWSQISEDDAVYVENYPSRSFVNVIKCIRIHAGLGLVECKKGLENLPFIFRIDHVSGTSPIECVEALEKLDVEAKVITRKEFQVYETMSE